MGGDLDSANNRIIKFLYSYGGKILPRRIDGKLRYVGGHTRVLAVDRSISYAELMVKLGELCGSSVTLRCQLPKEDLDVLVTVTSDEELANVIDEYHRASSSCSKIRAVLSPPKSLKTISPVSSTTSSVDSSDSRSITSVRAHRSASPPMLAYRYPGPRSVSPTTTANRCSTRISPPIEFPLYVRWDTAKLYRNPCHVGGSPKYY
ncbi:hypothetical protein PVL29_022695 [Vitis rotundifolia]|uniref:PB1 domain-containing protein n=1 Tax=Vitis rotundifolia TaxID=103349 RepID=A0AA38YW93_VITRO|nr:hypothetical protein PVL29_022695 [Vitis rotundifolia]